MDTKDAIPDLLGQESAFVDPPVDSSNVQFMTSEEMRAEYDRLTRMLQTEFKNEALGRLHALTGIASFAVMDEDRKLIESIKATQEQHRLLITSLKESTQQIKFLVLGLHESSIENSKINTENSKINQQNAAINKKAFNITRWIMAATIAQGIGAVISITGYLRRPPSPASPPVVQVQPAEVKVITVPYNATSGVGSKKQAQRSPASRRSSH